MKKGFTLVELLAVIVIISLTSTIVFPAVSDIITRSKQDLYNNQILDIQTASEKWATENSELLDKYYVNDTYITLELLRFKGYLEPDPVKNPLTRETMDGCIQIKYDKKDKKYKYAYEEKNKNDETPCATFASSSSSDNGYIIYSYSQQTKDIAKDNTNEAQSIGQYLVQHENIHTPGETASGLYELDDEYVYRGSTPLNYITFKYDSEQSSLSARILSISKKDYSIKIIATGKISDNSWDSNNSGFIDSNINEILTNNATTIVSSNKIDNYDFQIGSVSDQALSLTALKSVLDKKTDTTVTNNTLTISSNHTASQKAGTISILDYVNASATLECQENFKDSSCKDNNYLNTMFGSAKTTWTLNKEENNAWYILTDGSIGLDSPDSMKQIYAVYKLTSDVYLTSNNTNSTGSDTSPYEIK